MEPIRLYFKGISELVGKENQNVIILTDKEEKRQIIVVCDDWIKQQFSLRTSPVPTNDKIPEVLLTIISGWEKYRLEIHITDIVRGQYIASVCDVEHQQAKSISITEAILMAHIGNLPILIEPLLMHKQSAPYQKGAERLQMPLNSLSDEMLRQALERAIEDEDYELASHLRDEQNNRKNDQKNNWER